jgi:chromosome segregation ATPase
MSMEQRVSQLEQENARIRQRLEDGSRRFEELIRELRRTNEALAAQNVELVRLRTVIESTKCPAPGSCVQMREQIAGLTNDVDSLKNSRTSVMGGWKALAVLGSALTMVVGACAALVAIAKALISSQH